MILVVETGRLVGTLMLWNNASMTTTVKPKLKQFVTDILMRFQKGQLTLQEAADRLLAEKAQDQTRKEKSNRRLKSLCSALQRERNPAKAREIKVRLSHEFYCGDQVQ